ncbi:hypothetical protein GCM10007079_13440 [Nocardiopsis terrae]|uniref:Uncharacterized protein n=1 Tax=Nocardiopsis terrae TaxID=372655 RepID=A0ABR9HCC7_9ACTN|nr:hypothetical protein [Nocardiopsis terrae]MBE1456450.1 hypothetical protein [Nocardiopsis terrae]GHC76787.1 hypothetical protein GCM10007079_13440 [Nocardiopsis terrae]
MPSKRRKFSAFAKILLILTFVCGLFVAGGYYVLTTFEPLDTQEEPEPGCRLGLADGRYEMEVAQAVNAATVGGVAFSRDLPEEAVTVAYATVWQESTFYNVEYGDLDSLGLFQQRPSQEWGEPDEILDPVFASRSFYDKLSEVNGWEGLPVYEAAQHVQRSAHGFAYDQHEELSADMAEVFTGRAGPSMTCWFDAESVEEMRASDTDVAGAQEEMARVFGTDPAQLPVDPESNSGSGSVGRTGDLGWAMALWAVAHAEEYGITSVTYEDQRWQASDGVDGAEEWSRVEEDRAANGRVVLR